MSFDFGRIEDALDNKVADVLELFLKRLQSERDRILNDAHGLVSNELELAVNADFDSLLNQLLKVPFGNVRPAECHVSSSAICEEKTRKRKRCDSSAKINYEDLQIVATFKHPDVKAPAAITAISDKNCFAISHGGTRISLFTPLAKVKATYKVQHHVPRGAFQEWTCPNLAASPINGDQLYFTIYGEIHLVDLQQSINGEIDGRPLFSNANRAHVGLAVSPLSRHLFTTEGNSVTCYSLSDLSLVGRWRRRRVWDDQIVGFYDGQIFCRYMQGARLCSIPFDGKKGDLLIEDEVRVGPSFNSIRGATFDTCGNLLVASKGFTNQIEVFSRQDSYRKLAGFRGPPDYAPSDISMMAVSRGDDLFSFQGGEIRCQSVIVTPDFDRDRIFFLGCPIDCDNN